jgi:diaminopimelate decarboxylase
VTGTICFEQLAEQFGTPLYVYDGASLHDVYAGLRGQLHPAVDLFYSAKANPNVGVCAVLQSMGAGMEVSSLTELRTALWAGAAPESVIFLGPGKSRAELAACVELGIRAVVCESLAELALIDELSRQAGRTTRVLLRVNPEFTTKGSRLSMGGKPRQFGTDQEILRGAEISHYRHVRVDGIHIYMGTRILDADALVHNTRAALAAAEELSALLGFPLATVDVGGGFGIAYFENESDLPVGDAVAGINAAIAEFIRRHPDCRVIIELGRYLVARSGTYVVRTRYVKQSRGEQFAVTDGGMNHHMAAVGLGSFAKRNFPIRLLSRPDAAPAGPYTITGPLCTPEDVLGRQVALPELRPGDLIGIERAGAYGPTASPGLFLSHGYPAEVLVADGTAHLVRRRDTVDDLLAKQILPPLALSPTAPSPIGRPAAERRDLTLEVAS